MNLRVSGTCHARLFGYLHNTTQHMLTYHSLVLKPQYNANVSSAGVGGLSLSSVGGICLSSVGVSVGGGRCLCSPSKGCGGRDSLSLHLNLCQLAEVFLLQTFQDMLCH